MIQLARKEPFARGGNRLCYIHPEKGSRCIKVRRPDFTLADCRRKKGFPKNLRPLSYFDDNLEEFKVISHLLKTRGNEVCHHIYQCYGFVDTDLGRGLDTELIKDADGRISLSLKQFIWENGFDSACREAVVALTDFWMKYLIPSRDLLTHNVVVQLDADNRISRLVVIDGLGSTGLVPFEWLPRSLQQRRVSERVRRFEARIEEFVKNCQIGKQPSRVGMLLHRDDTAL